MTHEESKRACPVVEFQRGGEGANWDGSDRSVVLEGWEATLEIERLQTRHDVQAGDHSLERGSPRMSGSDRVMHPKRDQVGANLSDSRPGDLAPFQIKDTKAWGGSQNIARQLDLLSVQRVDMDAEYLQVSKLLSSPAVERREEADLGRSFNFNGAEALMLRHEVAEDIVRVRPVLERELDMQQRRPGALEHELGKRRVLDGDVRPKSWAAERCRSPVTTDVRDGDPRQRIMGVTILRRVLFRHDALELAEDVGQDLNR